MREVYKEVEVLETEYTKEEINKIVVEHAERIIDYCKDLEREYAGSGLYNPHETMRVLFDLRDCELYTQVVGQGIFQDIVEGIEDGFRVEVYSFKTGCLDDMAFEGLDYCGYDCEASELYSMYLEDEISEEEYFDRYDEVIQPWIEEYIEDYLNKEVKINIDYLNALGKENYDNWFED